MFITSFQGEYVDLDTLSILAISHCDKLLSFLFFLIRVKSNIKPPIIIINQLFNDLS